MTTFGQVLRKYRVNPEAARHRVISQEKLAEMIDVDASAVSKWESDSRGVTRANVIAIADALGLTGNDRAELFARAGYWPDHWDVADVWQWPGYRITIYDGVERAPGQRGATIGPEMTSTTLTRENVSGNRGAS